MESWLKPRWGRASRRPGGTVFACMTVGLPFAREFRMAPTRYHALLAVGVALAVAALADGPASSGPPSVDPHSRAVRLKAIQTDVANALAAYREARAKQ